MSLVLQRPLSPHARAALRRAADELLIDAIFGTTFKPIRDGEPVTARPRGHIPCRLLARDSQRPIVVS